MTVGSPRPSPLVEQAAQHLREQIAEGRWPVGARLPGETALAASLGVGRSTVREAVRALAGAGLLRTRQGAGVFVIATEPVEEWSAKLGRAAATDVHEVRALLETRAVRLAARRRTDEDTTALQETLTSALTAIACAARPEAAADPAARVDADLALHAALVAAAGNPVLTDLFAEFAPALRQALPALGTVGPAGHEALVAAVLDGDADTAERLVAAELDVIARLLREARARSAA
ncbi:FadR/GntR family transcriptional regulator [Streptomyces sp. CBMA29]|uniref:FadR/GntR family transcriptional regulator n=1 Tax=Streptomyces sp. CBMA29 TaxID=1896314 RepID=UPI001661FA1E|nr:GntR family transcriptional regulator [Streptomyces sp. CBMA29]MBD0735184.1 GntR family transcriptional regulator [Streptomyces sp. CBMA29]